MSRLLVAGLIVGMILVGCGEGEDNGATAGSGGAEAGSAASDSESANSKPSDPASPDTSEDAGSAPSETSEDGTTEKAAFVRKANQICQATTDEVVAKSVSVLEKAEREGSNRSAVEYKLAENTMGPELHAEIEQIEALGTPPGDEAQIGTILDAIREVAEEAEQNAEGVVNYTGTSPMAKPSELAEQYGLEKCPYG